MIPQQQQLDNTAPKTRMKLFTGELWPKYNKEHIRNKLVHLILQAPNNSYSDSKSGKDFLPDIQGVLNTKVIFSRLFAWP